MGKSGSQKRERKFRHVGHFNQDEQDIFDLKYATWKQSNEAVQFGESISAFIRYSTIGAGAQKVRKRRVANRYKLPSEKALLQLKAELNRVGNNINQIAHHMNMGTAPPPAYISQAMSDWHRLSKAINRHLDINP